MNIIPCHVNMFELSRELRTVPLVRIPDGSGAGHLGGPEGWIHGLSNARIRIGETYPLVTSVVNELRGRLQLGRTVQILVNNMTPGAELRPHRDGRPDYARYHLPVETHELAYWWDELEGRRHMIKGWWYGPVPYCGILHSAGNPSPVDRLHLIVDFEK
jgi:hypothetical protein